MIKNISSSQTAHVAPSRTIQTGYLPDPQRHVRSKTHSIPPRGHRSPPPFLTTLSVVHRWRSSLEGADHCENKPRTNMRPKTNVRAETTRYTSSRSLQKPGESNDSPLLKKTAPSHWKRTETSQKRLGELDAPQVRSYRTVNGVLHRSLQWESWRDQSRMSRVIRVTNVTFVTNGDADASNSMSDARRRELRPANDPNLLSVACSGLPLFIGSAGEAAKNWALRRKTAVLNG